jgi:hypothetical protein
LGFYKWLGWLLPAFEIILPSTISSLAELGQAMINSVARGYGKKIIEVKDIKILSKN